MTIGTVHRNAVYQLYERQMSRDDTLRAASELCNIDFTITSTLGDQVITNIFFGCLQLFWENRVLGLFAEGYGNQHVLPRSSGTAGITKEDIDLTFEERVEPEIETRLKGTINFKQKKKLN